MSEPSDSLISVTHSEEPLGRHVNTVASANKETRAIITPFAFSINDDIVGLPLASPSRRGIAIAIDGMLVALTAKLSFALVALVASVAIFMAASSKHLPLKRKWIRYVIRGLAVLGFLVTLIIALAKLASDSQQEFIHETELSDAQKSVIEVYQQSTEGDCNSECLREALIAAQIDAPDLFKGDFETMSTENLNVYDEIYIDFFLESAARQPSNDPALNNDQTEIIIPRVSDTEDSSEPEAGVIAWFKAILSDLGLGFGWAAVYFSVFPVLWRGQTPGKKLLNIRVLALTGNYLNLWDSFGRYGGYGAGFATGLLGFIQVLWDPNRQAIHDKIAGTVVIKGSPAHETVDQS
jgi:hypothetical protein